MQHPDIIDLVGHVIMDDDTGVGINSDLHIVGRWFAASSKTHRSCIGFAVDDQAAVVLVQTRRQPIQFIAPCLQSRKRLRSRSLDLWRLGRIGLIEASQILRDLPVDLLGLLGKALLIEHAVLARHPMKLGAIDRDKVRIEKAWSRQNRTNARQAPTMAEPLSRLKSAIVL